MRPISAIFAFMTLAVLSCGVNKDRQNTINSFENDSGADSRIENNAVADSGAAGEAANRSGEPRTVRDFFMLLPETYFTLEGCDRGKDKNCKQAREKYLKDFAEVDIANGYIKGGCDGGQGCIEMAIFKRPDGTYLVGVATFAEMMNDNYFLDYSGGKWRDVSAEVVPEFSKKNMYEIPRRGTTVQVFAKSIIEEGPDFEASEKGKKLYELI